MFDIVVIFAVAIVAVPLTFTSVLSSDVIVLIPVTVMPSLNDVSPTNVGIVAIPVRVKFLPLISSYERSAKVVNPVTVS